MTTDEEYVRQLEDAVNLLWGWMPIEEAKDIRSELPDLADFCGHIHHKLCHEEKVGDVFGGVFGTRK